MAQLKQQLSKSQVEAKASQENAKLTLLQLNEAQEEFELIYIADQSKQEKIKSYNDKLNLAQAELQSLVTERDEQLQQRKKAQQQVIKFKQKLEAKDLRLHKLIGNQDALAQEKNEAQKQLESLKKRLEAKETELQNIIRELHARNKEQAAAQDQKEVLASQNELTAKRQELQELEGEFHKLRLRHLRQRGR